MKSSLLYVFQIKFSHLSRRLLLIIFQFDKWHLSPLISRPYAVDIIYFLNQQKNKEFLIEIGCGLGDIIRNVKFKFRLGLDQEKQVLKAARFVSTISFQNNITFKLFTFPGDQLEGKYDSIIMVNWIHHIEPVILKAKILEYYINNLNLKGVIIFDTVQDQAYKFNHKIDFLTQELNCNVEKLGNYSRGREVWIIKKI